jgi:predicted Holliday junction resolvase-like endonuclease
MNLFSEFASWIPLISVLVLSAGIWVQSARIDTLKDEHAAYVVQVEANAAQAEQAKLEKETYWKEEVAHAQREAEKRIAKVQADLRSAHVAVGKLRNTVSALQSRLANASREAVLESAAACGKLLATCAARYTDMADKAERHAGDVRTLMEAWPSGIK